MRINNNVMALNAHRQLGINQGGAAKSMEKLSSGFRINRAGDDAAGLAISEKMRGQIRGLKQATRNAQDGISLLQTAEGALNESHAILQRMRELANQAANDTNVEADRGEIQKEINQLTSELNRIGNTTEFNTQKLLDGGNAQVKDMNLATTTAGGKAGEVSAVNVVTPSSTGKSSGIVADNSGNEMRISALAEGEDLNGYTVSFAAGGADNNVSVTTAGQTITITVGSTATLGDINTAIAQQGSLPTAFELVEVETTVTLTELNGKSVELTGGGADATEGVYEFDIDSAFANDGETLVLNVAGTDFTLNAAATENAASLEFAIGSEATGWKTAEEQAQSIADVINAQSANTEIGEHYEAKAIGSKIVLTERTAGAAGGEGVTRGTVTAAARAGAYDFAVSEKLEVGSRYIVDGQEILVTDNDRHEGLAKGTAILVGDTAAEQADNLRGAIGSNAELKAKYDVTGSGGSVTLTQRAGKESSEAPSVQTSDGSSSNFEANFQIGANFAQSMTVEFADMRAVALGVSGKVASGVVTAKDGKGATASFVDGDANVTNGTTNDNEEYALDISTHEKATAAIDVLDDAIGKVSAERSKMGAYQNRLEHTINNLGTSAENMQAAESRIRDLDMAEEIMAFTKNNILQQAATAMLAQANMAPQSVLQLLG